MTPAVPAPKTAYFSAASLLRGAIPLHAGQHVAGHAGHLDPQQHDQHVVGRDHQAHAQHRAEHQHVELGHVVAVVGAPAICVKVANSTANSSSRTAQDDGETVVDQHAGEDRLRPAGMPRRQPVARRNGEARWPHGQPEQRRGRTRWSSSAATIILASSMATIVAHSVNSGRNAAQRAAEPDRVLHHGLDQFVEVHGCLRLLGGRGRGGVVSTSAVQSAISRHGLLHARA